MTILTDNNKRLKVKVCLNFKDRFFGMMGKKTIDYGLFFPKCQSIHTCFMKYPIDIYIVDNNNVVIDKKLHVTPWRFVISRKKGYGLYEFMENTTIYEIGERIKQVA